MTPTDKHAQHRRMQIRGLLWLALAVVVFSIVRAALHHSLPPHWWLPW